MDVVALGLAKVDSAKKYARVFLPEAYGAKGDGTTDDTTAVQAAITAAVAAGGTVFLSKMYSVPNGGLTASGPVSIKGAGGNLTSDPINSLNPVALSGILTASATATALTCAGKGTVLEDFAVVNKVSTAPTAGVGINLTAASQATLTRVTVCAFYVNVQTMGVFWTINQCHFYDASKYSLWLNNTSATYNDHGDLIVSNSTFAQNYKTWGADAAIRWESGGGVRIIGNKILGGAAVGNNSAGGATHFLYGIDMAASDGGVTGDANIAGNSISNFNTAGIRITTQNAGGTAGFFTYSTIVGNNINVGFGTANACIFGGPTTGTYDKIQNIEFSGNNIQNVPFGIIAYNMIGLHVGSNTWGNLTGTNPYLVNIGSSPDDGTCTRGVQIDRQETGRMAGFDLVVDNRHPAIDLNAVSGHVDHSWVSGFQSSAAGTWVTIGYVDMGALSVHQAADLEVLCTLDDHTFGPIYARYRRIMTCSGAAPITLATDGTDTTAGVGSHYAVQLVTTTNNRVIIQVQATTGVSNLQGRVRVTARGDIVRSHKGA